MNAKSCNLVLNMDYTLYFFTFSTVTSSINWVIIEYRFIIIVLYNNNCNLYYKNKNQTLKV